MLRPVGSATWTKERVPSVDSSRFVYRNESITPLSPFEVKVGVYNTEGEGALSAMSVIYSGEDGECSQHGAGLLEAQRRLLPLSWNCATKAGCLSLDGRTSAGPQGNFCPKFFCLGNGGLMERYSLEPKHREGAGLWGNATDLTFPHARAHPGMAPGQQACPATQLWGHHMSV